MSKRGAAEFRGNADDEDEQQQRQRADQLRVQLQRMTMAERVAFWLDETNHSEAARRSMLVGAIPPPQPASAAADGSATSTAMELDMPLDMDPGAMVGMPENVVRQSMFAHVFGGIMESVLMTEDGEQKLESLRAQPGSEREWDLLAEMYRLLELSFVSGQLAMKDFDLVLNFAELWFSPISVNQDGVPRLQPFKERYPNFEPARFLMPEDLQRYHTEYPSGAPWDAFQGRRNQFAPVNDYQRFILWTGSTILFQAAVVRSTRYPFDKNLLTITMRPAGPSCGVYDWYPVEHERLWRLLMPPERGVVAQDPVNTRDEYANRDLTRAVPDEGFAYETAEAGQSAGISLWDKNRAAPLSVVLCRFQFFELLRVQLYYTKCGRADWRAAFYANLMRTTPSANLYADACLHISPLRRRMLILYAATVGAVAGTRMAMEHECRGMEPIMITQKWASPLFGGILIPANLLDQSGVYNSVARSKVYDGAPSVFTPRQLDTIRLKQCDTLAVVHAMAPFDTNPANSMLEAIAYNRPDIAQLLHSLGMPYTTHALCMAIKAREWELFQVLLREGVPVNPTEEAHEAFLEHPTEPPFDIPVLVAIRLTSHIIRPGIPEAKYLEALIAHGADLNPYVDPVFMHGKLDHMEVVIRRTTVAFNAANVVAYVREFRLYVSLRLSFQPDRTQHYIEVWQLLLDRWDRTNQEVDNQTLHNIIASVLDVEDMAPQAYAALARAVPQVMDFIAARGDRLLMHAMTAAAVERILTNYNGSTPLTEDELNRRAQTMACEHRVFAVAALVQRGVDPLYVPPGTTDQDMNPGTWCIARLICDWFVNRGRDHDQRVDTTAPALMQLYRQCLVSPVLHAYWIYYAHSRRQSNCMHLLLPLVEAGILDITTPMPVMLNKYDGADGNVLNTDLSITVMLPAWMTFLTHIPSRGTMDPDTYVATVLRGINLEVDHEEPACVAIANMQVVHPVALKRLVPRRADRSKLAERKLLCAAAVSSEPGTVLEALEQAGIDIHQDDDFFLVLVAYYNAPLLQWCANQFNIDAMYDAIVVAASIFYGSVIHNPDLRQLVHRGPLVALPQTARPDAQSIFVYLPDRIFPDPARFGALLRDHNIIQLMQEVPQKSYLKAGKVRKISDTIPQLVNTWIRDRATGAPSSRWNSVLNAITDHRLLL